MPEFVPQGGLGLYYRQPGYALQAAPPLIKLKSISTVLVPEKPEE